MTHAGVGGVVAVVVAVGVVAMPADASPVKGMKAKKCVVLTSPTYY